MTRDRGQSLHVIDPNGNSDYPLEAIVSIAEEWEKTDDDLLERQVGALLWHSSNEGTQEVQREENAPRHFPLLRPMLAV